MLSGLPASPVANVELCSIDALTRDIRKGACSDAFVMLLQPADSAVDMESKAQSGAEVDSESLSESARWQRIVEMYSDVFEPPGMPAERQTKHSIELLPGAVPPYRRQYRVSPAELAEVRR